VKDRFFVRRRFLRLIAVRGEQLREFGGRFARPS